MLRKTLFAVALMASAGAGLASTASAAPVNGAVIREAAVLKSDVTAVGYYGYSYGYHPRYYGYHRYYYPRYYGYGY